MDREQEMYRDKLIAKVHDLIKVDIDASAAYLEAVEHIDEVEVAEQMMAFHEDHERHIDGLNDLLIRMRSQTEARSTDFKGFMTKGFTSMRGVTGMAGALEVMHSNEKLTNKYYQDATEWDAPDDVQEQLQCYYDDEQEHLEYIEIKIEELKAHAHRR